MRQGIAIIVGIITFALIGTGVFLFCEKFIPDERILSLTALYFPIMILIFGIPINVYFWVAGTPWSMTAHIQLLIFIVWALICIFVSTIIGRIEINFIKSALAVIACTGELLWGFFIAMKIDDLSKIKTFKIENLKEARDIFLCVHVYNVIKNICRKK